MGKSVCFFDSLTLMKANYKQNGKKNRKSEELRAYLSPGTWYLLGIDTELENTERLRYVNRVLQS